MLNPSGGLLKKVFSPKTALKPFKAVHKALGPKKVFGALKPRNPIKAIGSIFGGGKKKATQPQPAPAAPARMRANKAAEGDY